MMCQSNVWLTTLFVLMTSYSSQAQDIRVPPSITAFVTDPPAKGRTAYAQLEIEIICSASGTPAAEFEWLKDGVVFNVNRPGVSQEKNSTSAHLTFSSWARSDNGYYQCKASNQNGATLSDKRHLLGTTFRKDPEESDTPTPYSGRIGEPLKIKRTPVKSIPAASFFWTTSDGKDGAQSTVVTSKRIMLDEIGNLYFAYIRSGDEKKDGWMYRCKSLNELVDIETGGSYSEVTIDNIIDLPLSVPLQKMYTTADMSRSGRVTALVGQDLVLKCIFSGIPFATVDWSRENGQIPNHRKNITEFTTQLHLKNLEASDEDTYVCRGRNSHSEKQVEIPVDIYASPRFKSDKHKPVDQTITEEEDAVFRCDTEADPEASVVWMADGVELTEEDTRPGKRFQLSDDNKKLTIPKTCKICGGPNPSDIMVLQCNASNAYGYTFASGYLNIVLKTEIILAPEDVTLDNFRMVKFECEAESDPATPVTIHWLHNGKEIRYDPGKQAQDPDTNALHVYTDQKGGEKFAGEYTCVAQNGYSNDTAIAKLVLPEDKLPVTASFIDKYWWLFLILALILLLIILLLCCCIFCYRDRGDKYYVDKAERKQGNDPEKELIDSGYHEYKRPEGMAVKGSRASLASTIHPSLGGSLAGSMTTLDRKYSEDGSFIGQYNTNRSRAY